MCRRRSPSLSSFRFSLLTASRFSRHGCRIRGVSRRPTRRVRRDFEGRIIAVGSIVGGSRSAAASRHGRRAQSILEPGQPVDRFLCGQSAENGAGERSVSGRFLSLVRIFTRARRASRFRALAGTWSSKDVIVFGPSSDGNLYQINVKKGGTPTPVTKGGTTAAYRSPSFLPDGQHFLYSSSAAADDIRAAGGIADDGGDGCDWNVRFTGPLRRRTRVLRARREPDGAALQRGDPPAGRRSRAPWRAGQTRHGSPGSRSPANGRLVFLPPPTTQPQLTWRDRSGRLGETVGDPGFLGNLDLSPDGRQLAFSKVTSAAGWRSAEPISGWWIWRLDERCV